MIEMELRSMMRGYIQDAVKAGTQLPFLRNKPLISR